MFKTFLGNTIAYLEKKLEEAEKSDYVEKPLSWALYQTWKWVDQQEQPRPRQGAARVDLDREEVFKAMLAHLGYDKEGHDIGIGTGGGTRYELDCITSADANRIKRYVNKQMNPYDRYCELRYDKATQTAWFDIVS